MFDIKQLDGAYNPQEQLLIALGVHPDQQAAKETVANAIKPPNASPAAPDAASAPAVPPIARPGAVRTVNLPMANDPRLTADQAEVDRLNNTGSGVSQIHNPFLRGIARIGDIAGSALFPGIAAQIPGTELHHRVLLHQAEGNVNRGLANEDKQAQLAKTQAETNKLNNPEATPKEEEWNVLNGMTGPNGEALEHEKHSGEVRDAVTKQPVTAIKIAPKEPKEGELPLGERIPQLNDMLTARYQVLHPGQALPKQYAVPQNATQKDYDRIDRALEAEERATATKAQQDTLAEMRRQTQVIAAGNKSTERGDKSYQFNATELKKMFDPVTQAIARMGRLQETLNQGTPQADALVAPELLSVMAGGAGSGLRMNEAEISRIVGGRSKWQSLQAAAQQWSTDPEKANSITPEQRQQIRSLVDAVHKKLLAKQKVLDAAHESLLNSDDPHVHRKAVNDAQNALTAIDEQSGGGGTIHYKDGNDEYDIPPEKEKDFLSKHPKAVKQ